MAHVPAALRLGDVAVRQHDGLFSLNDLHKASGGVENHAPNRFMRLETTRALIAELSKTPEMAFKGTRGRYAGTYACRELVIAYAAWISPAFHLKVIRVFLAASGQAPAVAAPPPRRNLVRGRIAAIAVTLQVQSGGIGYAVRLPAALAAAHTFRPGQSLELEYAPGANPLTSAPVALLITEGAVA